MFIAIFSPIEMAPIKTTSAARGRRREDTLEALKKLVPEYAGHNTTDAAII